MKKVFSFFSQVKQEFKKIEWPDRKHAIKLSLIVLAVCAIFGLGTGLLDSGLSALLKVVLPSA